MGGLDVGFKYEYPATTIERVGETQQLEVVSNNLSLRTQIFSHRHYTRIIKDVEEQGE